MDANVSADKAQSKFSERLLRAVRSGQRFNRHQPPHCSCWSSRLQILKHDIRQNIHQTFSITHWFLMICRR